MEWGGRRRYGAKHIPNSCPYFIWSRVFHAWNTSVMLSRVNLKKEYLHYFCWLFPGFELTRELRLYFFFVLTAWRFQVAGYRDLVEYRDIKKADPVSKLWRLGKIKEWSWHFSFIFWLDWIFICFSSFCNRTDGHTMAMSRNSKEKMAISCTLTGPENAWTKMWTSARFMDTRIQN